jgi:hypothetical protein
MCFNAVALGAEQNFEIMLEIPVMSPEVILMLFDDIGIRKRIKKGK